MGVKSAHERCPCGGYYLVRDMHEQSPRHRDWLSGQPEIPVPDQPAPLTYDEAPLGRIVFGETVTCPLCEGKMPRPKKGERSLRPEARFTRDKRHREQPCPRCDGKGVVPNVNV